MVEDCGFLCHPDGILGPHDVTEGADMDILHLSRPPGVQNARVGTNLVTFRMQMVFDGACAPDPHLIRCLDDIQPIEKNLLVEIPTAPERPFPLAAVFTIGGQHRVKLQDDLRAHASILIC
jgi:hypothetical protein